MESISSVLLRKIPSVDSLMADKGGEFASFPRPLVLETIRDYLDSLRKQIIESSKTQEELEKDLERKTILEKINERLISKKIPYYCRVINATGVVLHTGLGRAVLPEVAIKAICENAKGYMLIEVDRESGRRGRRENYVSDLLCSLTGAESATVVNNNAAATMLVLAALARGKEVIVSRSHLVEIGGSFRMPDVMAESGARLVEVGCTNRTYLSDYQKAITDKTAAILIVHTSNYKIVGFTHNPELKELSDLAHKHNLVLIDDVGSGAMIDLTPWNLEGEPVVSQRLKLGADIVTFSGDKLLGACQSGIILGKASLIENIKKHPLARAFRVGKLTLIALEATLKLYRDKKETPAISMLLKGKEEIKIKAEFLACEIEKNVTGAHVEVKEDMSQPGSGSLPATFLPTYVVALSIEGWDADSLAQRLRLNSPPIFTRIQNNAVIFDPRTILDEEDREIVQAISSLKL